MALARVVPPLAAGLVAALLAAWAVGRETLPPAAPPGVVLWAWERPEDLRFAADLGLAPSPRLAKTEPLAVAYLAGTVRLAGERVSLVPRRQPLALPAALPRIAVVRIEVSRVEVVPGAPPALSERQRQAVARAILATVGREARVQIDFDATLSQRRFYAALLAELRHELAPATGLSITALASWCLADDWLAALPIDEAVPMLFRMGVDDARVRRELAAGRDFRSPLCRGSYGLATDEPPPALRPGRRLWWFSPQPWTAAAVQARLASTSFRGP